MKAIAPAQRLLAWILCAIVVFTACQPAVVDSPNAPAAYADVRQTDMSSFTLTQARIMTYWFSTSKNHWSKQAEPIVQEVLEKGKNPGLGVRGLHQQGLTGKGITVAIIDQNLAQDANGVFDHPEYAGKILKYKDFGTEQGLDQGSMHGPAVTSLLVGETTGTAPGARLYYASVPSWTGDAQYYADALNWLVDENAGLPADQKIRAVSVSAAPSGPGSFFKQNNAAWDDAYARAKQAGILVLDCTDNKGQTAPCYYDLAAPDDVTKCTPGWPGVAVTQKPNGRILVPTSLRSQAEEYQYKQVSYQFTGQGGLSWSVPYLAGVLALGWQIRPDLTGQQMMDLILQTAYDRNGWKVINPPAFIKMVKQQP
jgi:serine protease AprX